MTQHQLIDEVNDFKVQGTIDIRIVNTVRRFLETNGVRMRSIAELQRQAFYLLEEIAIKTGTVPCEDTITALQEMQEITYGKAVFQNKRLHKAMINENEITEAAIEQLNRYSNNAAYIERAKREFRRLGWQVPEIPLPEANREAIEQEVQRTLQLAKEQEVLEQSSNEDREYNETVHKLMILKLEEYDRSIALAKSAKERRSLEDKRATIYKLAMQAQEDKKFLTELANL